MDKKKKEKKKMSCFIDRGDAFLPHRDANLSNIGCQNEITLVLNGSVKKKMYCVLLCCVD